MLKFASSIATYNGVRFLPIRALSQPVAGVVAVRRETKNRWERRTPLTPNQVRQLVRKGLRVKVQPSTMRIFPDRHYVAAGAELSDDLSEASVVLGVKEVPIDQMLPDRTFVCFSHTIKAQVDNMPMLDAFVDNNIRLIDYERMLDHKGRRVIGFGRFAGNAGMIDLLRGLGDRLLGLGATNPFLGMGYADYYHSLAAAKTAIFLVGKQVEVDGMPAKFAPAIFGFTGTGNVTQGAMEIFKELPHEMVDVHDLPEIVRSGDPSIVYGVQLTHKDLVRRSQGDADEPFDRDHYYAHPEEYEAIFHETVAPYITALVNCMYWDKRFPRLLTREQMQDLYANDSRLLAIADISADPDGSIEFTKICTTIDRPYLVYNPQNDSEIYDWEAPGVLLGSVDNLPAELPREASELFGEMLMPFVPELANSLATEPFDSLNSKLSDTVRNAIICCNGKLAPNYAYISDLRAQNEAAERHPNATFSTSSGKRVLLLGAGKVATPLVQRLTNKIKTGLDVHLTIASDVFEAAQQLAASNAQTTAVQCDAGNASKLEVLVGQHDVVVSLLPPPLHASVAQACLRQGKHLVTSSYVSPEMEALDKQARQAGLIFLNEAGLDPGIDHLAAMEMIEQAHSEGASVKHFVSWCGGLPHPDNNNNPLGYKFSWAPRGVLTAGMQEAKYLENGEEVVLKAGTVFANAREIAEYPELSLEGYPNRDSTKYIELYGLHKQEMPVATMLRGTLRYRGFCQLMEACRSLGLLDTEEVGHATSWAGLLGVSTPQQIAEKLATQQHDMSDDVAAELATKLAQLGVLGNLTLPPNSPTRLDAFANLLLEKLQYAEGEQDLVVLMHKFGIVFPDGREEMRVATLKCSGDALQESAMSRTVGVTTALGTEMVLKDQIAERGVLRPLSKDMWQPLLTSLGNEGIVFEHETRSKWM